MATTMEGSPFDRALPAPNSVLPTRPDTPQRKDHHDEMCRLREELEEMRIAKDQALQAREAMEDDLLDIQEKGDETENALKQRNEDLEKMAREVRAWRERAESLSVDRRRSPAGAETRPPLQGQANEKIELALTHERQQVQHLTATLAKTQALLDATTSAAAHDMHQQTSMEDARRRWGAQLAQAEHFWRAQVIEQQKLREAAEIQLQGMLQRHEAQLGQVEDGELQARAEVEIQQRRVQQMEEALQKQSRQINVDSSVSEDLERLREQIIELKGNLHDQHGCAEQYRRMSERLTTEVKQLRHAKRGLERSEQAPFQQMEDMELQTNAQRRKNVPGAFHRS
ncbi:hypothetical protein LTR17_004413 [Elasticomyces elasticus]|nr:hypothetical protein LTR17_004413 [Elasticomyces elasticus]